LLAVTEIAGTELGYPGDAPCFCSQVPEVVQSVGNDFSAGRGLVAVDDVYA